MTTIAWKDGVLAADSAVFRGEIRLPGAAAKIIRLKDGSLLTCAGQFSGLLPMAQWFNTGSEGVPPTGPGSVIHVAVDGPLRIYEDAGWVDHDRTLPLAWGSGGAVALGAMHCGADAVAAVATAIVYDVWSGGQVQSASPQAIPAPSVMDTIRRRIDDPRSPPVFVRSRIYDDPGSNVTAGDETVWPTEPPKRVATIAPSTAELLQAGTAGLMAGDERRKHDLRDLDAAALASRLARLEDRIAVLPHLQKQLNDVGGRLDELGRFLVHDSAKEELVGADRPVMFSGGDTAVRVKHRGRLITTLAPGQHYRVPEDHSVADYVLQLVPPANQDSARDLSDEDDDGAI